MIMMCMCAGASAFAPLVVPGRCTVLPIAARPLPLRPGLFLPSAARLPVGQKQRITATHTTMSISAGLAETLFKFDNVAVLPFWLLMILVPKSSATQGVMGSYVAFVPLALIYAFLVFSSITAPGGLDLFTSGAGVTLGALSKAFADPGTMAAGWAHYVCFDLFVGRWMWADGLRNKVLTTHSLVLGLFFGPVGLLSHLITRSLFSASEIPKDPLVDGLDDPMSDENLVSLIEDRR